MFVPIITFVVPDEIYRLIWVSTCDPLRAKMGFLLYKFFSETKLTHLYSKAEVYCALLLKEIGAKTLETLMETSKTFNRKLLMSICETLLFFVFQNKKQNIFQNVLQAMKSS
jgi:hypothetical protein